MTSATLFGRPLPEGGTIGVPAPASPFENRSEILRGVEWWEARGYRVKLSEHVYARDDYVAGDARDRAADLLAMFADPEVDVVQCLQGGYGSAQLIPYLDFDVIAANPKPFVGYSDITALHVAIRQETGLATFYGYGLLGMGDPDTTTFSRDRLLRVLRGGDAGGVPPDPDDPYVRPLHGGKVTAPLVGGCLWLLVQTMGTPWEFDVDGCILFFEDVDSSRIWTDATSRSLRRPANSRRARSRSRGDGQERLEGPARLGPDTFPGGRARGAPGASGCSRVIQAPLGHGKHLATHSARRDRDARCGREDAHDRRVRPGD